MNDKKKTGKKKEDKKDAQSKESTKNKPSKFKFECTKCGACCHEREDIPVTFSDIASWTKQGSFMSIVLPHLELQSISTEDELGKMALVPYIIMKDKDENGKGTCACYDVDNKICNIYFTLPIFCKTFPLSFNGEKFYVSDTTCEGLGKGEMTKSKLSEMRQTAMRDFNERADTTIAMIPLQGMFIRHFMRQSQETVKNLSEDDQKKLDDLIKKSQESPDSSNDKKEK